MFSDVDSTQSQLDLTHKGNFSTARIIGMFLNYFVFFKRSISAFSVSRFFTRFFIIIVWFRLLCCFLLCVNVCCICDDSCDRFRKTPFKNEINNSRSLFLEVKQQLLLKMMSEESGRLSFGTIAIHIIEPSFLPVIEICFLELWMAHKQLQNWHR